MGGLSFLGEESGVEELKRKRKNEYAELIVL
jgi:hypothetical protein